MKYLVDTHTHTIASGHAYNTILEMARAAKDKELEIIGITEHSPGMPGSCSDMYFSNLKVVDRELFGVEVLLGVELNIIGFDGKIDLRQDLIEEMDVVIASLHGLCIGIGTVRQNTNAILGAIKNPLIDIIGHPDDGHFPVDYKEIVLAAKEYNKILELNNSSLNPKGFRINARENNQKMLSLCAQHQLSILIGSDAHFASAVGDHSYADEVLKDVDFPQELILNYNLEKFRKTVRKYKKI